MSGEGFGADAGGGGFESGAEGAGAGEAYAGYDGQGDRLPSSTSPASDSRPHPGAREQPAPSRHDSPPGSWAREHHVHWANVPEPLRPYLHERERQAHEQITKLGGPAKAHGEIAQAFERYGMHKLPQGVTHATAVESLLAAGRMLQTNPVATLRWLAGVNKVDLKQLAGVGDQEPSAPLPMDPRLEARLRSATQAERTVVALQQELAALKRQHFEQAREAEKQRRAENERAIKEARRQASINQTSGRGGTPVKTTVRASLERHANRLMGG